MRQQRSAGELERSIRKHVRALPALEILLLVHRTRGRSWTAAELNRELRRNPLLVTDVLSKFERSELPPRVAGGKVVLTLLGPLCREPIYHALSRQFLPARAPPTDVIAGKGRRL